MKSRAVRADARYILRHWSRSGQAVVISLLVPLILLAAFGFLFTEDTTDPPLVHVADEAGTEASRAFVETLQADGLVRVREGPAPGPGADLAQWLAQEGLGGIVVVGIPEAPANESQVAVRLAVAEGDGLDTRIVRAAVERAADDEEDRRSAVLVTTHPLPERPSYRAFLLPGILGLSVALSGISAGFSSMTELRHMGLLQRLAASPLGKAEWLLGRMLGSVAIGLLAAAVLVLVAWLMEPGSFRIGPWTVVLVVGGTLVFAGLGTLLGLAVTRPEVGTAILNLALLPLILLSGTFFSIDEIPAGARWLSVLSPLTHLTKGLRADMLPGSVMGDPATSALMIGVMALVVLVVGARLIRWTERD